MTRADKLFVMLVSTGILIYLFGILLNYDNAWIHPENIKNIRQSVCRNGPQFTLPDLKQAFNYKAFELGAPRLTRPLSSAFQLLNIKIRLYLWKWFVPHPSFSISWFFAFILSPILMFLFFRNFKIDPLISFFGVAFYHTSIAFLGPIIMLFHPAKAFANFTIVLIFWLMSKAHNRKDIFITFLILGISFFWDESVLFVFGFAIIFFYMKFHEELKKSKQIIWLGLLPITYFLCISKIFPWIASFFSKDAGSGLSITNYEAIPKLSSLIKIDDRLFQNASNLLMDQSFLRMALFSTNGWVKALATITVFSIVIFLIFILLELKKTQLLNIKKSLILSFACLVIYIFAHNFQMVQNPPSNRWGIWYYGSFFTFFFSLVLVFSAKLLEHKISKRPFVFYFFIGILLTSNLIFSTYRNHIFIYENKGTVLSNGVEFRPRGSQIFNGEINEFAYFNFGESFAKSKENYQITKKAWIEGKYDSPDGNFFLEISKDPLFYLTQELVLRAGLEKQPNCVPNNI